MPRVAKKADPADTNEQIGTIMDFLATSPGRKAPAEAPKSQRSVENASGVTNEALAAQIAVLNERIAAQDRMNQTLLTNPQGGGNAPPAAPEQPKPIPLDLSGLPDPWADGPAYTKAYNERLSANITANMDAMRGYNERFVQHQQQAAQGDQRFVQLWDDFVELHPEYEGQEDQIGFVASKVVTQARSRGIDPNRYMLGATPKFFDDVLKEYKNVFGEPKTDGAEPTVATPPAERANRTAGIPGGLESGGSGSSDGEEKPGNLTQDLKDLQRSSGFF